MKIKHILTGMFAIALIGSASVSIAEDTATKTGKTIFSEQKCDMCHSVTSAELVSKKKSGAVDLSDVGTKGDAAFFKLYLKKEAAVNDKKHPIAFKGTDGDFDIIALWLSELKVKAE